MLVCLVRRATTNKLFTLWLWAFCYFAGTLDPSNKLNNLKWFSHVVGCLIYINICEPLCTWTEGYIHDLLESFKALAEWYFVITPPSFMLCFYKSKRITGFIFSPRCLLVFLFLQLVAGGWFKPSNRHRQQTEGFVWKITFQRVVLLHNVSFMRFSLQIALP